jgi:hypothetical protein
LGLDNVDSEPPPWLPDFLAALVWAFDPDRAEAALMALQQAQALVVGEEDRLLAAIIEYADELLGEMNYWHGRARTWSLPWTAAARSCLTWAAAKPSPSSCARVAALWPWSA